MNWRKALVLLLLAVYGVDGDCEDDPYCDFWAWEQNCLLDPTVMMVQCPLACGNPCECNLSAETNDTACDCVAKAKAGYCSEPGAFTDCFTTCSLTQTVNCPELADPSDPNAKQSTTSTSYLTEATEVCLVGHDPANPGNTGKKICISDGNWVADPIDGLPIQCNPVNCGEPPTVENATVYFSSTFFSNSATYTCVVGFYQASGHVSLTCGPNATWTGTLISCQYVNCGNPPVAEGRNLVESNGSSLNGFAKYSCSSGWQYVGGDTTLVCSLTNQWTGEPMTCERVDCGTPSVVALSDASMTSTNYESVATYACQLGHEPVGGSLTRTCEANGTWSGSALVCVPVVCENFPVYPGARSWTADGGIIDPNNNDPFLYGTEVFHECFYQEDDAQGQTQWVQECGPDKEWVGDDPKCGANSDFQRETLDPEPVEAPGSWAVGLAIFSVIIFFIVLFVIMDLDTLRKHSKYMKANIRRFRKTVRKRWKWFKQRIQLKSTRLNENPVEDRENEKEKEKEAEREREEPYRMDEVYEFPGDIDDVSEFNFSTGSASIPSTPRTMTSFV